MNEKFCHYNKVGSRFKAYKTYESIQQKTGNVSQRAKYGNAKELHFVNSGGML